MKLVRCWTGRRWVEIGSIAIGFGPRRFIERIHFRSRLVWAAR